MNRCILMPCPVTAYIVRSFLRRTRHLHADTRSKSASSTRATKPWVRGITFTTHPAEPSPRWPWRAGCGLRPNSSWLALSHGPSRPEVVSASRAGLHDLCRLHPCKRRSHEPVLSYPLSLRVPSPLDLHCALCPVQVRRPELS